VLSRVRAQGARGEPRFPAQAVLKLALALLLVILLALSSSPAFVAVCAVALLARVSLLPARGIARLLRVSLPAALFTAAVLLPSALLGNPYSLWMITPKVFASVTALGLLSLNTRWNGLTAALKIFFIPDIFIFVLDIAVKYILLLGEFALNMLWALRLRSVGRNAGKRASLSGIAGGLFLKSRDMAAEMHAAMECRGFTGEYARPARFSFGVMDACVLACAAALIFLFVYLRQ
jgi:cobalt/nickel transport system permease protein